MASAKTTHLGPCVLSSSSKIAWACSHGDCLEFQEIEERQAVFETSNFNQYTFTSVVLCWPKEAIGQPRFRRRENRFRFWCEEVQSNILKGTDRAKKDLRLFLQHTILYYIYDQSILLQLLFSQETQQSNYYSFQKGWGCPPQNFSASLGIYPDFLTIQFVPGHVSILLLILLSSLLV